jgi:hypothetical protein
VLRPLGDALGTGRTVVAACTYDGHWLVRRDSAGSAPRETKAPPAAEVIRPRQAVFYEAFTRRPLEVSFSAADQGMVATYFARWVTGK